ncbi:MAG TPA: cytochrome c oxidase subunit II [Acidimicrobiales bacterium]|nr:cytochrome c oxidase subunit II [Acidimicrobiales bacterium]
MTDIETPPGGRPRLEIDPWERIWLVISMVVLTIFAAALIISAVGFGFTLPGASGRVDPRTVTESGDFAEPRLEQLGDDRFVAYVVSRQFVFEPATITVPRGAEVTFKVTSSDVQHAFRVADTNVNVMAVPGQISELTATFDDVGEFAYVCSEFCGLNHHNMFGTLRVVPPEEFDG